MADERGRILGLVAEGKINPAEAERLLDALEPAPITSQVAATAPSPNERTGRAKYMFVKVVSREGDNVDVKIPLGLVRAGLKLTSLIPPQAMEQINKSMADSGVTIDFSSLKPENIEELIESLREMEVNVDSKNGDNVRVYCA